MRLIDADALYKSFGASGNCNNCPLDAYKCQYYNEHTLMEFCERIDDAPTVDAVEVVRCKDCRFSHMTYSGECKSCDKWVDDDDFHLILYLDGDFYCAFGERREDETD